MVPKSGLSTYKQAYHKLLTDLGIGLLVSGLLG
jgi:hypothetical protein